MWARRAGRSALSSGVHEPSMAPTFEAWGYIASKPCRTGRGSPSDSSKKDSALHSARPPRSDRRGSLHALQLVNRRRLRLALPHASPSLFPPDILHLTDHTTPRIAFLSRGTRPLIPPNLGFRAPTQIRPKRQARVERRNGQRWLDARRRSRKRPYGVRQSMLQG